MIDQLLKIFNNFASTKPGLWGEVAWYVILAIGYGLCVLGLFLLLRQVTTTRAVKLIGGVLILAATVRGLIYVGLDYPWQVPDEHGHFEYVALTARLNRVPVLADIDPNLQREILQSMYEYRWWPLGYNRPMPVSLPRSISDDPDLAFSWVQVGDEPFLYYSLMSPFYQLVRTEPLINQLYTLRTVSSLLLPLTVLLTFLCLLEVFADNPYLIVAATTFVGFHSMFAYVNSGITNDIFGTFTAIALMWAVYRLFKNGLSWKRVALIAVLTAITVLSNKPNLYLLPWSVLALGWFALRPTLAWLRRHWRIFATAAGIVVMIIVVLAILPSQDAAEWTQNPWPGAATRAQWDGKSVLYIRDDSIGTARPLIQDAAVPVRDWVGKTLHLSIEVRGESGSQPMRLQLFDGVDTSVLTTTVSDSWQTVKLKITPSAVAWRAKVLIAADNGQASDTGALFVRNVRLTADGSDDNFIANGSGQATGNLLTRLTNSVLMPIGITPELFTFIRNPHLFDDEAKRWYERSIQTLFEWFWGRFAYIAVPLRPELYQILLVLTIVAGVGLIILAVKNWRANRSVWGNQPAWRRNVLTFWALAFVMNLIEITFPMLREIRVWQPQGRYLFPTLLPIGLMLCAGWLAWFPTRWQKWGLVTIIIGLIALDVIVIAGYIIPHYYLGGS